MNLETYYDIIVEPMLSMLIDIYDYGGISFEDAQRIGSSLVVDECIGFDLSNTYKFDLLIYNFELKLEKIKRKRKGKCEV